LKALYKERIFSNFSMKEIEKNQLEEFKGKLENGIAST